MKTKILLLLFSLGVMLSCDKNIGEPAPLIYYFQLHTVSEGKEVEFFSVSRAYDYKMLKVTNEGGRILFDSTTNNILLNDQLSNAPWTWIFFNETKSFSVFHIETLKMYLDYGNGDIDTLTQTTSPVKSRVSHSPKPDTIYFQLNGKPVFKYAYKSNVYEFGQRNNVYQFKQNGFDPVIFTLHKTAEK